MSRIVLKNICKSYSGIEVLKNINLEVEEGEIISLLGPSGCGKTTTLKIISGLEKPDSGFVFSDDRDITDLEIEKRGTVIVFQDHLLFPHMNVEENIGFGLRMSGVKRQELREQVEKFLELIQLKGYNKKYPHQLSGGQRQRVALARALILKPRVLLLDEPFSNLDRVLREEMREFTLDLQKKLKITTILVTHDREEAMLSSKRVAVMMEGSIRQFAPPKKIYEEPASVDVADFMGERNYIEGSISKGYFLSDILSFDVDLPEAEGVIAMIKPEDIRIIPYEGRGKMAVITEGRYAGDRIYYTASIGDKKFKISSESRTTYDVGEVVRLDFNIEAIKLFEREGEAYVGYTCKKIC